MSRPRIAILGDDAGIAAVSPAWRALAERADLWFAPPETRAADCVGCAVICTVRERVAIDAADLAALPDLRLLTVMGRPATIDADAARAAGVMVTTIGGGASTKAPPGPVEHAWALILGLAKQSVAMHADMVAGAWRYRATTTLAGKTLGLVGLGKTGRRMAAIAQAFDMRVIAWSLNLDPAEAEAIGVDAVDKAALFASSDIVSVHYALGPRSVGLVGAADFAAMKPGALFINTSRGRIVEQPALIDVLAGGGASSGIGGAGLDVFADEPLPADHPLRRLPNVLLSPHAGYATREALTWMFTATAGAVADWLNANG